MKKSMMMIAMVSAFGMTAAGHAAQPEQKSGQDRTRSEYTDPAKKCDGLKGDARSACLKDVQRDTQRQGKSGMDRSDMKSAPRTPDAKK